MDNKTNNEKYIITKKSHTFRKKIPNYLFSEKEKFRARLQANKEDVQGFLNMQLADKNGNYKITFKPLIDDKINLALKREYNIFNVENQNYRVKNFNNIGSFEIFKINGFEYLIEKRVFKETKLSIAIYNYEYYKKWLTFLDGLVGNYCFGQFVGFKEDMINDAKEKNIDNFDDFAKDIESIFYHCLDFHNDKRFEYVNHSLNRYDILSSPLKNVFLWKQTKDGEVNKSIGNLLTRLEDLFISSNPSTFMQIRDFVILWINKIIGTTINNDKKMFQWAYSPFMDDVFNLDKKITKLFSDDRITLKSNLQSATPKVKTPQQKDKNEFNIEKLKDKQNKLIPKIDIDKVINHFKVLTEMTNKNNEFYLTNEQFHTFINSTFIEQKPVKQKFNCTINTKKEVRKIFYDFYFKSKNKEYNQTSLKRKYFNILNDAFEGFNENDYTDFAK